MPPHCDTLDGPVVKAARRALERGNVNLILPWVPKDAEHELREAFAKALRARKLGNDAAEVGDYWFFETAVRLHRQGEGAPYTGLKPAGLDWGPVVRKAERALETGDPHEVIALVVAAAEDELRKRFARAMDLRKHDPEDVDAARAYVGAMLGFVLYSHHLHAFVRGEEGEGMGGHEH